MTKAEHKTAREAVRDRLNELSTQARKARLLDVADDQLCDALDDIDNTVQEVIAMVAKLRSEEGGA